MPDPAQRGWVRALGPGAGRRAPARAARRRARRRASRRRRRRRGRAARTSSTGSPCRSRATPRSIDGDGADAAAAPARRRRAARPARRPAALRRSPTRTCSTITASSDPGRGAGRAGAARRAQLDRRGRASTSTSPSTASAGAPSAEPAPLAFEPPFLAMTLALLVAALLAGLHGAFRFGPAAARGARDRLRQGGPGREQRRPDPARPARGAARRRLCRRRPAGGGAGRRRAACAAAARSSTPISTGCRAGDGRRFSELAAPAGCGRATATSWSPPRARSVPMEEGHHPVNVTDVKALADDDPARGGARRSSARTRRSS